MSPDDAPTTYICTVCAEQAPTAMTAECNWCDRPFHLNQRNDVEAKDCGQVWVDEQYLALQFACNICLAGTDRDPAATTGPAAGTRAAVPQSSRQRRYKRRA